MLNHVEIVGTLEERSYPDYELMSIRTTSVLHLSFISLPDLHHINHSHPSGGSARLAKGNTAYVSLSKRNKSMLFSAE